MTTAACGKSGRKHTPIKSEAQQGMMGAELARRRAGKKGRMSGMTTQELRSHLMESAGKKLPPYAKGSPQWPDGDIMKGYQSLGPGLASKKKPGGVVNASPESIPVLKTGRISR